MKIQAEILSYILFSFLVVTTLAFIIYYFWFFENTISKNIYKINLYSVLSVFESPIIIFNSVCDFCKINYNFNLAQLVSPSRFLFIVYYNTTNKKINFKELYSEIFISSSILNYLNIYPDNNIDVNVNSLAAIVFEINNFEKKLVVENV